MSKVIITSNPSLKTTISENEGFLNISELFSDTIQGEGFSTGVPSTFLRLKDCTLNCTWCDTTEVWRTGNPYNFSKILSLLDENGVIDKLEKGQHLVFTGGSPLLQQQGIVSLMKLFYETFYFLPFIEIENECVLEPCDELIKLITQWNNSPKLENSNQKHKIRYKPELLRKMSNLTNSWFKFVVNSEECWKEIESYYINTGLVKRKQVILMPEGQTRKELDNSRENAVRLAIKHNVRYCDRQHVTIWDKKTGV